MQGFFHGGVAELEPLLHEVDAQQGLHRKGLLAPATTLGGVGLYQRNQFGPGDHQLHGIQEFALARSLGGVAQAQAALLHARIVWASCLLKHITAAFVQRIPCWVRVRAGFRGLEGIAATGNWNLTPIFLQVVQGRLIIFIKSTRGGEGTVERLIIHK